MEVIMHHHERRRAGILFSAILAALSVAGLAAQQPPATGVPTIKTENARPIRSTNGVDVYMEYCAVCHGTDGKGHGPAASALKGTTPDLTILPKNAAGVLSRADMELALTGKGRPIPAHGTADMPMWGSVFKNVYGEGGARMRLSNLMAYIESIQAK
jgi:mono/diheme cytochrome c family protein